MTATFTWIPDTGAKLTKEPRLRSAKFGDGYEQRAQDGINANMQKRELSFSGRGLGECDLITAFLDARGGTEAFYYTHSRDIQRLWICRSWSSTDSVASGDVVATFEEVPA